MNNAVTTRTEELIAQLEDVKEKKFAILQLAEGVEENSGIRFTETLADGNAYEMIYFRTVQNEDMLHPEKIFIEFNADKPHPGNYYGTSPSVGDIILISQNGLAMTAYRIDMIGMSSAYDVINEKLRLRFEKGLDIRKELNLLENQADKNGLEERIAYIKEEYSPVFSFAERRVTAEQLYESGEFELVDETESIEVNAEMLLDEKHKKAVELATEMDAAIYDYDTYGYWDAVGNSAEARFAHIESIMEDVLNGKTDTYADQFLTMMHENTDKTEVAYFRGIVERLKDFETRGIANQSNQVDKSFTPHKTKKLQLDMDGTLANLTQEVLDADGHFHVSTLNKMMKEEDFFYRLSPFENMIAAIKLFIQLHPEVEVSILSTAMPGEPPSIPEQKSKWLDKYLPEVTKRYFVEPETSKGEFLEDVENCEYYLLDDYNVNLESFQSAGGTSIKMKNTYNGGGTGKYGGREGHIWEGPFVAHDQKPEDIVRGLEKIMELPEREISRDKVPLEQPKQETMDKVLWKELEL